MLTLKDAVSCTIRGLALGTILVAVLFAVAFAMLRLDNAEPLVARLSQTLLLYLGYLTLTGAFNWLWPAPPPLPVPVAQLAPPCQCALVDMSVAQQPEQSQAIEEPVVPPAEPCNELEEYMDAYKESLRLERCGLDTTDMYENLYARMGILWSHMSTQERDWIDLHKADMWKQF